MEQGRFQEQIIAAYIYILLLKKVAYMVVDLLVPSRVIFLSKSLEQRINSVLTFSKLLLFVKILYLKLQLLIFAVTTTKKMNPWVRYANAL